MMYGWEVQQEIEAKAGIRLRTTFFTTAIVICEQPARPYRCELHGPFEDVDQIPSDVRIFVVVRDLEGSRSMQLLVQDKDDDVFLNSNAYGAEKYNKGPINV